jgi:hypothetical protein
MRITEVEKSPEDIKADQEARIAKRRAEDEQKRAEAAQQHKKNKGKSVSPSLDAELKGKGPEIGDDQKTLAQDLADVVTGSDMYKRGVERLTAPYDKNAARANALYSELGDVETATGIKDTDYPEFAPAELPKPKYRKAERFSKTVLNNPNSVLQFDVPGYRTGTVGKPGTIQEKWQQFKTQSVKEKAPPGDKYERMIKDIKKGYAKDGKLTDTERGIAYATAWKLYNKRKGKKS